MVSYILCAFYLTLVSGCGILAFLFGSTDTCNVYMNNDSSTRKFHLVALRPSPSTHTGWDEILAFFLVFPPIFIELIGRDIRKRNTGTAMALETFGLRIWFQDEGEKMRTFLSALHVHASIYGWIVRRAIECIGTVCVSMCTSWRNFKMFTMDFNRIER